MADDDRKRPRYMEGDDQRSNRGFAARDTDELPAQDWEERTPVGSVGGLVREHEARLNEFDIQWADLVGAKGDNGKFGNTRRELGLIKKVLGVVFAAAVAAIGTAAIALYQAGQRDGRTQERLDQIERALDNIGQRIERLNTPHWPDSSYRPAVPPPVDGGATP